MVQFNSFDCAASALCQSQLCRQGHSLWYGLEQSHVPETLSDLRETGAVDPEQPAMG